ncbi:hypothetical protein QOZ80_8AG0616510 [Eleusine coracana subsp. coracana]|nr:hypothetical protein QOZ80_8AG0616510 [Eleusine coracana subsp. coracana]
MAAEMQQQQQQRPPAAATAAASRQSQKKQLFRALYGELLAEARGTAFECGANVRAIVFRPGGGAGRRNDFLGAAPEEAVRKMAARDVSAMGPAELARHAARLQALRAAVARKLQEKMAGGEGGMVKVKREAEEQVEMLAGCSKIRRVQY